jgi:CIC family chloride channel protein
MIVSAISTAMSRYAHPHSLDQAKLTEENGKVMLNKDSHILSDLSVHGFIERDFIPVKSNTTLRSLVEIVAKSKRNIFPVLSDEDALVGIISLENIREIMFNTEKYDSVSAHHLMQKPAVTADLYDDMSVIMEKFDKSGVWNIPVLDDGKYLGFISKSRIFSNYRDKLRGDE